jgi:hypothetical protein
MYQLLRSTFDHCFGIFSTAAEKLIAFIDQQVLYLSTLLYPFRKIIIAVIILFLFYSFLTAHEWRIYLLLVAFHLFCAAVAVLQRYYHTETNDNDDDVEDVNVSCTATANVDIRDARLKRFDIA